MKRLRLTAAVLVLSLSLTVAIQLYKVPEPEWEREVLDNETQARFLQLGSKRDNVHIVYQKSSEEGVNHLRTQTTDSPLDAYSNLEVERDWVKQKVDSEPGSGTYMSMTDRNGQLSVSYQDSTVGSEKVVYANFSEGNWSKEVVDDAEQSGFNVGMYSAITLYNGEPVVAYHSPRDGLEVAFREDGEWQENNIGGTSGWFTSAASCGEKLFLAYSGRDSDNLNISSFDGSNWETEKTGRQANHHIETVQENCVPSTVYLNPSNGQLEFRKYGARKIADTKFARTGIVRENGNYHISYRDYGEGVFYANSTEGKVWNRTKIGANYQSGKFNDIIKDTAGNIHIGYSNSTSLVHAEYNEGTVENIGELKQLVTHASLGINLIILVVFLVVARRNRFFTKLKQHMIQEVEEEFSEYSFKDDN